MLNFARVLYFPARKSETLSLATSTLSKPRSTLLLVRNFRVCFPRGLSYIKKHGNDGTRKLILHPWHLFPMGQAFQARGTPQGGSWSLLPLLFRLVFPFALQSKMQKHWKQGAFPRAVSISSSHSQSLFCSPSVPIILSFTVYKSDGSRTDFSVFVVWVNAQEEPLL